MLKSYKGGDAMKKIECEILAPVGRLDDLSQIIDAGADAVYFGLKGFSSRPKDADLSVEELCKARIITRDRQIKMYVAINAAIADKYLDEVFSQMRKLESINIDAFILADYGIINFVTKMKFKTPIHVSTLTGVYNIETVDLLSKLGVSRIILSSDLYIDEMLEIIYECPKLEYEIVADGGICFNSNRQCVLPHVNTMENFTVLCQLDYILVENDNDLFEAKRIGNCPAKIHRTLGIYLGMGIKSYKIEGRTNPLWYIIKRVKEMKESKTYYMQKIEEIPGYMHYIYRNAQWL